mgnify:CR=1 FL=1
MWPPITISSTKCTQYSTIGAPGPSATAHAATTTHMYNELRCRPTTSNTRADGYPPLRFASAATTHPRQHYRISKRVGLHTCDDRSRRLLVLFLIVCGSKYIIVDSIHSAESTTAKGFTPSNASQRTPAHASKPKQSAPQWEEPCPWSPSALRNCQTVRGGSS